MKFNLTCPSCKKPVTVSTRGSVKCEDEKKVLHILLFCPECGEEIDAIPARQGRTK